MNLGGASVPVKTYSSSVSTLPSDYWPPGNKEIISYIDNIAVSTYPTEGTVTVHQETDLEYLSSTPAGLIDVEVETGDMVQLVIQARLSTNVIYAPPPVDVTPDLRMHLTNTTIAYAGHNAATVTIEGGAIEIFCCSE